jgi:hypothetical protein
MCFLWYHKYILHLTSKTSFPLFQFVIRALFIKRNSHVLIGVLLPILSRIKECFIDSFLIVFEFSTDVLKICTFKHTLLLFIYLLTMYYIHVCSYVRGLTILSRRYMKLSCTRVQRLPLKRTTVDKQVLTSGVVSCIL